MSGRGSIRRTALGLAAFFVLCVPLSSCRGASKGVQEGVEAALRNAPVPSSAAKGTVKLADGASVHPAEIVKSIESSFLGYMPDGQFGSLLSGADGRMQYEARRQFLESSRPRATDPFYVSLDLAAAERQTGKLSPDFIDAYKQAKLSELNEAYTVHRERVAERHVLEDATRQLSATIESAFATTDDRAKWLVGERRTYRRQPPSAVGRLESSLETMLRDEAYLDLDAAERETFLSNAEARLVDAFLPQLEADYAASQRRAARQARWRRGDDAVPVQQVLSLVPSEDELDLVFGRALTEAERVSVDDTNTLLAEVTDYRSVLSSEQLVTELQAATSRIVTIMGHNEGGELVLPDGSLIDLQRLERLCIQEGVNCVMLSCRSREYLANGDSLTVRRDLSYDQAGTLAMIMQKHLETIRRHGLRRDDKRMIDELERTIKTAERHIFAGEVVTTVSKYGLPTAAGTSVLVGGLWLIDRRD